MKYRPDVDGLRAIAILLVLFFHAGFQQFSSGFVGVDIFFVISGFLITSIIYDSLEKNQFSFLEFYSRRLWRMQPVFICLIIVCFFTGLYYFLPDDLLLLVNSIHKSSLFSANIFFEKVLNNYFAPNGLQWPLLHIWSLSIEWQCYFSLPIFIFLLHRFFSSAMRIKIIYGATVLFFLLSFYFSLEHVTITYFRLPSRIFEFLIGSCIAVMPKRSHGNSYVFNTVCILAFAVLIYVATRTDLGINYPDYHALMVCIATGALIALGELKPQPLLTRLLSTRPVVFIGLISYSLYLWHWPLLAFLRYQDIKETPLMLLITFSIIFVVAWFSWRFIERPTRKLHVIGFKPTLILLFICPILVSTVSNQMIKKGRGYPERFPQYNDVLTLLKKNESKGRMKCLQQEEVAVEVDENCTTGTKKSHHRTAFMIGDSFANHLWRFIEPLAEESNFTVLSHSFAACLALPGIYQYDWKVPGETYQGCHEQTELYYSMIRKNHYDMVIIAQHWVGYLDRGSIINDLDDKRSLPLTLSRVEEALDQAIQIIIASGSQPVLVKTVGVSEQAYGCYYRHVKKHTKTHTDLESCDFPVQQGQQPWVDDLFLKMQKKYSELIIIDPKLIQCPNNFCKASIDGIPVYRDAGHITDYAAHIMGTRYLQQYKNPFARSVG